MRVSVPESIRTAGVAAIIAACMGTSLNASGHGGVFIRQRMRGSLLDLTEGAERGAKRWK